ncbi:hypothetical protein CLHOM_34340 [Clostridium homopropionicum DSM 5847]|uniref:Carboxymuconolactone decarboxylase family protein n=1 Tax=Clostridium homopropionicum DSM 5847 TaxID=1121318 RepID=A0A0L6Z6D5_9CLOT|nr:carboxymuconolactone decarboxylase family protein [Clostridium homopropionicum]KOA18532.1 hypothetical protein CLHOM_34340 [Clostridium homopropionicum DSM 5847]SFF65284.1 Alkylhydroperoxidase family enzyme, contains CxxC motif [Clostridium homopropionicum]
MPRITLSNFGTTPFQQLLGHNKNILENWNSLEEALFSSSTFSPELKEEVRRNLAFLNKCPYCMAKGKPNENETNLKITAAVRFIKRAYENDFLISEADFEELRKSFNDSEISELCALICFITACQKFGALLDLEASCKI